VALITTIYHAECALAPVGSYVTVRCAGTLKGGRDQGTPDGFGPPVRINLRWVADDGSRWRGPGPQHGFKCRPSEWVRRLGARCRCVSLHHGLGLWPAAYKDVARLFVHLPAAPLEVVIPDPSKCAVVVGALKAKRVGGRPMDGPALTAPAPAGVRTWRSGRGKACGAVELEKFELDDKESCRGRAKQLRDEKMDRTLGAPP
jgi:hypothetical protein